MIDSTTRMPVEEYLALSSKPYCEYLDGVLRQKAWPTYEHGMMEGRLPTLINQRTLVWKRFRSLPLK